MAASALLQARNISRLNEAVKRVLHASHPGGYCSPDRWSCTISKSLCFPWVLGHSTKKVPGWPPSSSHLEDSASVVFLLKLLQHPRYFKEKWMSCWQDRPSAKTMAKDALVWATEEDHDEDLAEILKKNHPRLRIEAQQGHSVASDSAASPSLAVCQLLKASVQCQENWQPSRLKIPTNATELRCILL